MAHFIGIVQGNRGEVSRLGSRSSNMDAMAQGWKIGGRVSAFHKNGKDYISFTVDGGSGGGASRVLAGVFTLGEDGQIIKVEE